MHIFKIGANALCSICMYRKHIGGHICCINDLPKDVYYYVSENTCVSVYYMFMGVCVCGRHFDYMACNKTASALPAALCLRLARRVKKPKSYHVPRSIRERAAVSQVDPQGDSR